MNTVWTRHLRNTLLLGTAVFSGSAGCGSSSDPLSSSQPSTIPHKHALPPPTSEAGPSYALAENVPFAELTIPSDSRGGAPIATSAPLRDLTLTGGDKKQGFTYTAKSPIKPRGLFFFQAPPGMVLHNAEIETIPYRLRQRRATHLSWHLGRDAITVRTPEKSTPQNLLLSYPRATERERALHFNAAKEAGLATDEASFVRRATVQAGWTSRQGLLLPAPARAGFDVVIPPAAVLSFAPGLAKPEFDDLEPSDGCTLRITLDTGDGPTSIFEQDLALDTFPLTRVDLSAWSGKKGRLTFHTLPGASNLNDLCFVGEPILASNQEKPRRVVMIFVDTLRPDHLSLYGYERSTSPKLDQFAEKAAVFNNARSVAPWTLPSSRSVITGRHPELYDVATTLPARLGEQGFATGMIAGNVYLTANFGMHRDWDLHTVDLFPPANTVTDQALDWLGDHEGTDALLMVHYMSAHLPYKEPEPYLSMWAKERPSQLKKDHFVVQAVRSADRQNMGESGRQYIRDRYDQTIRWVDDEVSRLIGALNDDDIVVFFSDHGEEFWEHNGYEHGHTLFDELLRVPLVIRAPNLQPGSVDTPVSLLDITPTVLDLLSLDPGDTDGTSLVKLAAGDPTLSTLLQERPQTFGRPLYGFDRWGVLVNNKKWTTHSGQESLYDLSTDPGEHTSLGDTEELVAPFRAAAAAVLGTQGGVSYRFLPSNRSTNRRTIELTVNVPGGIAAVWKGGDPHQKTPVTLTTIDDDTVKILWHKGSGGREVYVMPEKPVAEVTHGLNGHLKAGNSYDWTISPDQPVVPTGKRHRLAQLEVPEGAVTLYWGMAPPPPEGARELNAADEESTQALEQLGYKDPEAPREPPP